MKAYVNEEFYSREYLMGRKQKIPSNEFNYFAMLSTAEIRKYTFGRIDDLKEVPDEVKMCCCEVAEKLYSREAARSENGLILQSYGNDGDTGTYKVDGFSDSAMSSSISNIVKKWILSTGLMYCGCNYES